MRNAAGFTLVEMITIIIILGILAVVALPRMMGSSDFRAAEFHDRTVATLRFAQKSAISHRRMVCVSFTASTVSLTIDHVRSGSCSRGFNLPGSNSNVLTSSEPSNVVFDPVPAGFNFRPDGRASANPPPISIVGQPPIVVIGATGHVH